MGESEAPLNRSEQLSLALHQEIASQLTPKRLAAWRPKLLSNIARLRDNAQGEPHLSNIDRWQQLIEGGDISGLMGAMTQTDRAAIEMREVAPFTGLLDHKRRLEIIRRLHAQNNRR